MQKVCLVLFLVSLAIVLVAGQQAGPEQIHLAFGHDPTTEMVVMWSMPNASNPVVFYGIESGSYLYKALGSSWQFTDGNPSGWQWMNRVMLSVCFRTRINRNLNAFFFVQDLKPGQKYFYVCESAGVRSKEYFFTSMQAGQNWEYVQLQFLKFLTHASRRPYFLVYGDMGEDGGAPSLPLLIEEAATGKYTAVIHVGDFAYDLDDLGGVVRH